MFATNEEVDEEWSTYGPEQPDGRVQCLAKVSDEADEH